MVYVGINNYPNTKEHFENPDLFKQKQTEGNALQMKRGANLKIFACKQIVLLRQEARDQLFCYANLEI